MTNCLIRFELQTHPFVTTKFTIGALIMFRFVSFTYCHAYSYKRCVIPCRDRLRSDLFSILYLFDLFFLFLYLVINFLEFLVMTEWTVILFTNEDTVEAVPIKWMAEHNSKCYWPPANENVRKAIRENFEPGEKWTLQNCKKISKNYENLTVARSKALEAECRSELGSTSENNYSMSKKKRQTKINRRYISDSDSSESLSVSKGTEELLELPTFIKTSKSVSKNSKLIKKSDTSSY